MLQLQSTTFYSWRRILLASTCLIILQLLATVQAAGSCHSTFTTLYKAVNSGSDLSITICPGSVLQFTSEIQSYRKNLVFQCGEGGTGTDCILEPSNVSVTSLFTVTDDGSGAHFIGLTFRNPKRRAVFVWVELPMESKMWQGQGSTVALSKIMVTLLTRFLAGPSQLELENCLRNLSAVAL
jgi:hypothetical protein